MIRVINRWLEWKGLKDAVRITRELPDRVFGWPVGYELFAYALENMRIMEPSEISEAFHGSVVSFREDSSPSVQLLFHAHPASPFVEIDVDAWPPSWNRPHWVMLHGISVLVSEVRGRKWPGPETLLKMLEARIRRESKK